MANMVDLEAFEFLMQSSQGLWREPSFERLIRAFTTILQQNFSLKRVGFFDLRVIEGKITWEKSQLDQKGFEPIADETLHKLEGSLLTMDLKAQEYRQGVSTVHCDGKNFNFLILGDPASDWHIFVWEAAPIEKYSEKETQLLLDFLIRQLQSTTSWFGRLDKTQAMLYKDDLTGLFNIRYLDVALESEIRRVQRFQTCFSLLFIDLDNFKAVNDTHGHLAGSAVLKQVADVLRNTSREVDSVMRYGGDEFVVILLGANSLTGLLAAERIRKRIELTDFKIDDGGSIKLTASIGVASCPEHATDKSQLLKMADETLYEGKRDGKNKVVIVTARKDSKTNKITEMGTQNSRRG